MFQADNNIGVSISWDQWLSVKPIPDFVSCLPLNRKLSNFVVSQRVFIFYMHLSKWNSMAPSDTRVRGKTEYTQVTSTLDGVYHVHAVARVPYCFSEINVLTNINEFHWEEFSKRADNTCVCQVRHSSLPWATSPPCFFNIRLDTILASKPKSCKRVFPLHVCLSTFLYRLPSSGI
jgi:hypothetical protein